MKFLVEKGLLPPPRPAVLDIEITRGKYTPDASGAHAFNSGLTAQRAARSIFHQQKRTFVSNNRVFGVSRIERRAAVKRAQAKSREIAEKANRKARAIAQAGGEFATDIRVPLTFLMLSIAAMYFSYQSKFSSIHEWEARTRAQFEIVESGAWPN